MIPGSLTTLTAAIFVLGGLLTCFAGYRLFRVVLGIFGFLAGAILASSAGGPTASTWTHIMFLLVGGIVGAIVMVVAYFVAIGLIGAGLAAAILNLGWRFVGGEPPTLVVVLVCVVGAVIALRAVRYVVVCGTAIAGAWTFLIGATALLGDPKALKAASTTNVWVVYPIELVPANWMLIVGWVVLAIAGMVVQFKTTTGTGTKKKARV